MSTRYKNFTKRVLYVEALKGEYYQEYPEFTLDQIRRPIHLAAGWVDYDLNRYTSEKLKMFVIDCYKEILSDREQTDESGLEQTMLRVLYFLIKVENVIRFDYSPRLNIPFPEKDKDKYLDFISKMTERIVRDMCDTLEKKISHAGKVEYLNWMGPEPEPEENKFQNSAESFVENVSGGKRPTPTVDDPQPFTKNVRSRNVRFSDESTKIFTYSLLTP